MFSANGFGSGPSWMNTSQLESLITAACDPSQFRPDPAKQLEVAEYINQKKANTPREAALLLARLANHRNPHVGSLALSLLATLTHACGYPFHLQIATKEFLNELVRRFPERPPPFPGPVMDAILALIHEWAETICKTSRWKQDLGNIRDMHRLLSFKGYRFRDLPASRRHELGLIPNPVSAAAVVGEELKSAAELEEEDREAQQAKLQELIRRGTPRDLAAAQELMKSLAGAEPDKKPDYRAQALTELNKLESKVVLLGELLDNVDTERGERFAPGDAYDQVASILSNARPKIQQWISNAETHDPESLDTFLQINDQINTVLARYDAYKRGDLAFAANPIPSELSSAASNNLIDFDDSAPSSSANQSGSGSGGVAELADLFGGGTGPGGGISLGQSPPPTYAQPVHAMGAFSNLSAIGSGANAPTYSSPSPLLAQMNSPPPVGSTPGTPLGAINLPGTPQPQQQPPPWGVSPGQFRMGPGMGGGLAGSANGGSRPQSAIQPQPQQPQTQAPHASQNQNQTGKDPFADLAGLF